MFQALTICSFFCSYYHVVDNIHVVGDPAHLVTHLHVHPLGISSSQNRSVGVSLQSKAIN